MDLGLLAGVLWRSRILVAIGVLVACALAVYAMAEVKIVNGRPQLAYRTPVLYQSTVQLLVTQPGFPEGRSVFDTTPVTLPSGQTEQPTFADPSRFSNLATLYAQLVMGNAERLRVFGPKKPQYKAIFASAMPSPGGTGNFLPILQITGVAPSPLGAMKLADLASASFSSYLVNRQAQTVVGKSDRVILDRIAGPMKPTIYQGRKQLRSVFAFAVVLMLTIAAAFIRDNLRGRRKAVAVQEAASIEELTPRPQGEMAGRASTVVAHEP